MQAIKSFKDDLIARYGQPLHRIGFDLALGCPNRVGGFGPGCTFCAADGSRARHLSRALDLAAQARAGIAFVQRRYQAQAPYIAYFQSFTNTNAPVERLRALYEEALRQADFRLVIVSTRPDALPDAVIDWLCELNTRYEVWIELGVQTACDRTLERVRRGHDWRSAADAARRLAARGLRVAAHLILGLPGETEADWLATARQVAQLPFQAVKIHQLMVLRDTALAAEYRAAPFPVLNEYEYASGLAKVLAELPDGMLVMRLTAEAAPEELIAPKWWMTKGQFLEFFHRCRGGDGEFPSVVTGDGSRTLYHPGYRQHFHSLAGAAGEAEHKFIAATGLPALLAAPGTVRICDIGFGLGGNSFAALRRSATAAATGGGRVAITAFELDDRVLRAAQSIAAGEEAGWLERLLSVGQCANGGGTVRLRWGDARQLVRAERSGEYDLVFLDGFSPDVNPELWSWHFLRELRRLLKPGGRLVTYSSAYPVRGALLKLGMQVGESAPFGRKRGGTIAVKGCDPALAGLPPKELAIIRGSTAGVPYSDRELNAAPEELVRRRERTVRRLRGRGVPKWAKF